jgi:hypothetical protein
LYEGDLAVTDHTALVLLAAALATLTAALVAAIAGYLARRDHASYPQAIARGAATFAATLTLAAAAAVTLHTLMN